MPPKVKITKEDIIKTATQLVRESGEDAINARAIASALGCSTQPIFSNFATMEQLQENMDENLQKAIENSVLAGKVMRLIQDAADITVV